METSADRLNKKTSKVFVWTMSLITALYSIWSVYCFNGGIKEYILVPLCTFTIFYSIGLLRDYIDTLEKRVFDLENRDKNRLL